MSALHDYLERLRAGKCNAFGCGTSGSGVVPFVQPLTPGPFSQPATLEDPPIDQNEERCLIIEETGANILLDGQPPDFQTGIGPGWTDGGGVHLLTHDSLTPIVIRAFVLGFILPSGPFTKGESVAFTVSPV